MLAGTGVSTHGRKRRGGYPRRYKGGRRSYPGRRRYGLRPRANPAFAAKVLAVVKPESKFTFNIIQGDCFVNNPVSLVVSGQDEGVGASQRIGNWIQPTSLYGHVTISGMPEALRHHSSVKLCFLQFHDDSQSSAFDPNNILENNIAPGGPWKVTEKGKWSILWSKYLIVVNHVDNSQFTKTVAFNINMRNRPRCLFAEGLLKREQIFFVALSDAPGNPDEVQVLAQVQLRYSDS